MQGAFGLEARGQFLLFVSVAISIAGALLLLGGKADAALVMRGDVASRHRLWAKEAAANVPLANARVTIDEDWDLLPEFYWGGGDYTIDLPRPGRGGWNYHTEHGLFVHEIGHLFDATAMTPELRAQFKALAGTRCSWNARHCLSHAWRVGPNYMVDVPPVEMFAEMYAACSLGLTEEGYQEQGYNTYGWEPPRGSDAALCGFIRSVPPVRYAFKKGRDR